jgi:hypothetical protein
VYKSLPTTQSDRPEGLAMLPARAKLGDLLVYLRGARVPFAVRYIPEAKRSGQSSEVLQWKKISQKLGVNFETEFLACRIVGECLVNGFDEFVQEDDTASNDTEGVASMLPGKKPLVNEMRRIFLIS